MKLTFSSSKLLVLRVFYHSNGKRQPGQKSVLTVECRCGKPGHVAFCVFGLFGKECGVCGNWELKKSTSVQNLLSRPCVCTDDSPVERLLVCGGLDCPGHSCDMLE